MQPLCDAYDRAKILKSQIEKLIEFKKKHWIRIEPEVGRRRGIILLPRGREFDFLIEECHLIKWHDYNDDDEDIPLGDF